MSSQPTGKLVPVPAAPPTNRPVRFEPRRVEQPVSFPMPAGKEINYIHEQTIFGDQIEKETKAAADWYNNWGFLANKPQPPPRGFSLASAKYTYGGSNWTLEQKRVPDNSKEGITAAEAERNIRKTFANLTWQTKVPTATKPCEAKGAYKGMILVDTDTSGVKNRESVRKILSYLRSMPLSSRASPMITTSFACLLPLFKLLALCYARTMAGAADANAPIPVPWRRLPYRRPRSGRKVPPASVC